MAPAERITLPFRWQFVPGREPATGSIVWSWRAYSQTGELVLQAERSFETLTECMQDAKQNGYDKA
jgi:hypothetical protein